MAAPDQTLTEFFPKYNPPIRAHKHTCVGLGMEVIKRLKVLEKDFPGITKSMTLVSCDENIQDVVDYTTSFPGPQGFLVETEKDHVMVAIHVRVGGRVGVFLSDLGYHISRVVTVMADRCYPHTGNYPTPFYSTLLHKFINPHLNDELPPFSGIQNFQFSPRFSRYPLNLVT